LPVTTVGFVSTEALAGAAAAFFSSRFAFRPSFFAPGFRVFAFAGIGDYQPAYIPGWMPRA
jgi:hypothetical protein